MNERPSEADLLKRLIEVETKLDEMSQRLLRWEKLTGASFEEPTRDTEAAEGKNLSFFPLNLMK